MTKIFKIKLTNILKKQGKYLIVIGAMVSINVITSIALFDSLTVRLNDIEKQISQTKEETVITIKLIQETETVEVAESESMQEVESVEEAIETTEEVVYFDVPLSEDLQNYIFEVCEQYDDIDPSIIIAMIEKESNYDASVMGDGGNAYGLMQIQPRWHQSRIKELGVTDLLDPYQNVAVGIDYLADLLSTGKSLEWALMAYNGGPSYANEKVSNGIVTSYASTVLQSSLQLQ